MESIRGAVFDLGSNSVKFMLAEQKRTTLRIFHNERFVTRLGSQIDQTGKLDAQSMANSLAALREGMEHARHFEVDHIVAVGTSAIRSAENRKVFLDAAKKILGSSVHIISGRVEAELFFKAINTHKKWQNQSILGADLGGGSIEFIEGNNSELTYARSLPLGAVRIFDTLLKANPVPPENIEKARNFIEKKLISVRQKLSLEHTTCLTSGGTAFAIASMIKGFSYNNPPAVAEGVRITTRQLNELMQKLAVMSTEQIIHELRIPKNRADIITAGALVLLTSLETLNLNALVCSTRGIRYGAWAKWICSAPFTKVAYAA